MGSELQPHVLLDERKDIPDVIETKQEDDDETGATLPTQMKKKRKPCMDWSQWLTTIVVIFIFIGLGVICYQDAPPPFVPLPFAKNSPAEQCILVDATLLKNLSREERWRQAVLSIRYHMRHDDLEGASAFHIGEPYCFMILRTRENKTLEMFNPRIIAYSPLSIINRDEVSFSCPEVTRTLKRFNHVLVSYLDAQNGESMIVRFDEREAWAAQHITLHSMGYSICELYRTYTDNGVDTFRQLLAVN